jgi:hypothetical protein
VYQARRGGLEIRQVANTRPLKELLKLRKSTSHRSANFREE